jgi:hypothetical protein
MDKDIRDSVALNNPIFTIKQRNKRNLDKNL